MTQSHRPHVALLSLWLILALLFITAHGFAQTNTNPAVAAQVTIDWSNTTRISRSTPTLQVVVNPPLRRGSTIHDPVFAALHDLGADYVRYVPWLPYPRLAVAELQPPTATNTSWDFHLIDPLTVDFLDATKGHSPILNFSTIPTWLFQTPKPVTYPDDPDAPFWSYTQGTELVDPTMHDLGAYYARLVSWYSLGGFTDENGVRHNSGYHYEIPWWEVLNEIEAEHQMTPQQYTKRYDAIVSAIHQVLPRTKFIGLALAFPRQLQYFEYFLNPTNHQAGIPLDMISYHFYANPPNGPDAANPSAWHFCEQADTFLDTVHQVEAIRQRLSPATQTDIDELGVIAPDESWKNLPIYWNAAGAEFAYLYLQLSRLGIEVIGESQLVGYPTQYPSVSMVDWETGKPNARFWTLKLLKDNFHPGDKYLHTDANTSNLAAQAVQTADGRKLLLLVNKENLTLTVNLPENFKAASVNLVDASTGENPAATRPLDGHQLTLTPFAVAVLTLPQ